MRPINIAVCDDCLRDTEIILKLLAEYQENRNIRLYYESFTTGKDLITALDSGFVFDFYLLDILMQEKNGIELAQEIRTRDADVYLIFLTSSPDYSLPAFGVSALQYILKPIDKDKLFSTLDKIICLAKKDDEQYLMLSAANRIIKIPYSSIICAELSARSIMVYLADGSVVKSKTIRSSFEEATAPLLSDSRFICPHKSFVVNMMWIEELAKTEFSMKLNIKVPIPQYRYTEVKMKYFAWLSAQGIRKIGGK